MVPYKISIFIWFEFLDGCNCTTNLTYILYLVLKRIWNLIDFQGQGSGTLLIFKVKGQGHRVKFLRQFSMHFVIANSPT